MIVGLGNPGTKYTDHRHNIGFMFLDALSDVHWRRKFNAQEARIRLGNQDVILLKPESFMNLSGDPVSKAMQFYKLAPKDVLVIHDELDLPMGRIRLKTGGGHAGHNGLRSIIAAIGPEFSRLRIGIGHPGDKSLVSPYVLHDLEADERATLTPILENFSKALPHYLDARPDLFEKALVNKITPQVQTQNARAQKVNPENAPKTPWAHLAKILHRD